MGGDSFDPFLTIIAIIVFGGIAAWKYHLDKKRREAMALLASKLGLQFDRGRDYKIADRHRFLERLDQGKNRYAFNVMSGDFHGHPVTLFDYHYEITSGFGKNRRTDHYFFSFFILQMDEDFPQLTIAQEGFFSKIGQAFGNDDIDFESHEFSDRYVVRCADKKFAYDFCNAKMNQFLLDRYIFGIEVEKESLAIGFETKLSADQIEKYLIHLLEIRTLMPNYLFAD